MIESTLPLADKKQIIITFLQQCNDYSDTMLKKYKQQLIDEETKATASQKLNDWAVYKEFNTYAINELNGTELDDWFE